MKENRYYTIQHHGYLGDREYWFEAEPKYYGIDKANHFFDLNRAQETLDAIIATGTRPAEEYRIIYHVHTEEVVA